MSLRPDYVTLAEMKSRLRVTNTDEDAPLQVAITAASRAVEKAAGRQFGQDAAPVLRTYQWHGDVIDQRPALPVDDFMTSTGLVIAADQTGDFTYSSTLVNGTDVDLWPYNAAADGVPWTHILMRPQTFNLPLRWPWPRHGRAVQVTAKWGWSAIPSAVEVATAIQVTRWFMRKDSWWGIAGSPELGSEVRLLAQLDPDVQSSLQVVQRFWGAA